MLYFTGILLLLGLHIGFVHGMDCYFGSNSNDFIDKFVPRSCPSILDLRGDRPYCCYDISSQNYYCCDSEEFAVKTGLGIILPVVITAVIVILLITCCISCLCCRCCPWYRRRNPGTVYGKVQVPSVTVIQPTNIPPAYAPPMQNQYVANPPYPSVTPQSPSQYTNEAYAKQAPYNPSYQPQ